MFKDTKILDKSSILVFVAALVVFFISMNRDLNIFDEGIIVVGAMRVLDGDVPHRDFYHCYGPAQLYIVAALTKLFGSSILVPRLYGMMVCALVIVLADSFIRKHAGLFIRLVGMGIAMAFIVSNQSYLYPIFPPIALAFLGSAALLSKGGLEGVRSCAFAGACAGVAALFRYESGFFILAAHITSIVILVPATTMADRLRKAFVPVFAYGLAAAAIFAPFAVSFLLVGGLDGFLNDIVDYPVNDYARMRGLPFPGLQGLRANPADFGVYFPVIVVAASLIDMLLTAARRQTGAADPSRHALTVIMILLTVVFFYKGSVRVSPLHMLMSILPACILLAILLQKLWAHEKKAASLALLAVAGMGPALGLAREAFLDIRDPGRSLLPWAVLAKAKAGPCETVHGESIIRVAPDYVRAANLLRASASRQEDIFVGLNRHDRILINPVALYYLADHLPGTAWHYFDPGMQTRGTTQRLMVQDLKDNAVKWVVRDRSFDAIREPNGSAISDGGKVLDQYLQVAYRPYAVSGQVEVWIARDQASPEPARGAVCMAKPSGTPVAAR